MGRVLAKCREGHVNEVAPGTLRCPECRHEFISKGWMPTATAEEILATHGKVLTGVSNQDSSRE